jgi:hypothetical protein
MSFKTILFTLGCVMVWFVLLPAFVFGGGIALLSYAVIAELGALVTGKPAKTLDTSAAREIARRVCGGYPAEARNTRRLPLL